VKAHQKTIGLNDEWLTPRWILEPLGEFDLDPASPENRPWPTAKAHISEKGDGLHAAWIGRVWLNPPFNRYQRPKWMKAMAEHGNGIMLIPAATETDSFTKWVWQRADAVCFVRTRPHFHFVDGARARANCGCSIVLVAYGHENALILQRSGLGHFLWNWSGSSAPMNFQMPIGRPNHGKRVLKAAIAPPQSAESSNPTKEG